MAQCGPHGGLRVLCEVSGWRGQCASICLWVVVQCAAWCGSRLLRLGQFAAVCGALCLFWWSTLSLGVEHFVAGGGALCLWRVFHRFWPTCAFGAYGTPQMPVCCIRHSPP